LKSRQNLITAAMSSKGGQGPGPPPSGEERLQVYLTIFTINNIVRELVVELNLRSVEAFLRFVERHLGGSPGLMKIFKLR